MQSLRRRANRVYYWKYANAELSNHEGGGGGRTVTRDGVLGEAKQERRRTRGVTFHSAI